jgi:WD40 repeat protein
MPSNLARKLSFQLVVACLIAGAGCGGAKQPPAPAGAPAQPGVQAEHSAPPATPSKQAPDRAAASPNDSRNEIVYPKPPKKLPMPTADEQTINQALLADAQALFDAAPQRELPAQTAPVGTFQRLAIDWCQATLVESYEQHGQKDERWDAQVVGCLGEYVKRFASQPDAKTPHELTGLCNEAFKSGCRDPLFYYLMARVRFPYGPSQDLSASFQYSKLAVNRLEGTPYSAAVKFMARYQYLLTGVQEPATLPEHLDAAVQIAVAAAAEPMPEGQRRVLLDILVQAAEVGMADRRAELVEALFSSPQVDPWIARMFAARQQIREAWVARGSGFANTITPEGGQEFSARMAVASRLLLEAWKLHPDHPEAAGLLVKVTASGGGAAPGTPRQWFDQAVQAEFDFEQAYTELLWFMRPRWGGSHEEMLAFGRECLATGRFDTKIPWLFHKAVTSIIADLPSDKRAFYRTTRVYEDYRAMLQGYMAADSAGSKSNEFRSMMTCVAWLAGKDDDARRMAEHLGQKVVSSAFLEFGATLSEFRKSLGLVRPETRELEKFARHSGLTDAALLPDGKTLFTAGAAVIRKWDVSSGKEVGQLTGHNANIGVLAVSSDGKWLASGDQDGTVRLWDLSQDREERLLKLSGKACAVCWSSDGHLLATASIDENDQGEIVIWKMPAGERANEFALPDRLVRYMEFTPDGGRLAAAVLPDAPDGRFKAEVSVWDVATGQILKTHQPFEGPVNGLAFSPDGSLLATVGTERYPHRGRIFARPYVRLIDADSGEVRQSMTGHEAAPWRVRFLHGGKSLVSSGEDKTARFWDVASGKTTGLLQGHEAPVIALTVDASGSVLVTADAGGAILDWDVSEATLRSRIQSELGRFVFKGGVKELRFLPEDAGLFVTAMQRGTSLWKSADHYQSALMFPGPPTHETFDADISPDGRTLGAVLMTYDQSEGMAVLFDVATGEERLRLPNPPRGLPRALRFSPDGTSIVCGDNAGRLIVYNAQTCEPWPWGVLTDRGQGIGRLAFSRDGRRLLSSGDNGTVRLWQLPVDPQQKQEKRLKTALPLQFPEVVQCLSLSADGSKFAVGCSEATVFDSNSLKKLFTVPGQEVVFSPDGALVATAGGKLGSDAAIWDAVTGEERLRLLGGHTCDLWGVVFSPDGRFVVTGDLNGNLCLWDARTGEEIPSFSELSGLTD